MFVSIIVADVDAVGERQKAKQLRNAYPSGSSHQAREGILLIFSDGS